LLLQDGPELLKPHQIASKLAGDRLQQSSIDLQEIRAWSQQVCSAPQQGLGRPEEDSAMPANPGPKPAQDDAARPQPSDRITISLIPQAAEHLQLLQDRTKWSKTDLVNRAITLYEFIEGQIRQGQDLILRDRESGETQLVRFL
jgi:hypothetical protein